MRALTIWPEWVWAITRLGKNVENRSRTTHVLKPGDLLAIHAGAYLGGTQKYVKPSVSLYPVYEMAKRAGWRIGVEAAANEVVAYNVNRPETIRDPIHKFVTGSVAAVATFGGVLNPSCVPCGFEKDWPWWDNLQHGYILENVTVLRKPIWCRGQQGLWTLPDDVEAAVSQQISST